MDQNIDYRNAKYQGCLNSQNLRHGIGILIDDDLSFYISDWQKGQLSGQTMIYLNHGKYIYGEWAHNQPHGLNVFRIGDTVLVAYLQNGEIKGRMIVIFQRFNFITVLQSKLNSEFQVIDRGQLRDHEDLLKYITIMQHQVPENYFSLIKFICSFVNENIKAVPSKDGNCYFGFDLGLAIVFNSYNGVVSVGYHKQGKLVQFGGKFEASGKCQQGNFQTKQIVSYRTHRPRNEIYSVFQKTHKRALSFQNSYFHSKFITLAKVQNLLRGKIGEIADNSRQNKVTLADLNDSLDYQPYTSNEGDHIAEKRMNLYEKPILPIKKTTSKLYDETTPKTPKTPKTPNKQKTPRVTKRIIEGIGTPKNNQKEEVITVEKFQPKKTQKTSLGKIRNKSQVKNGNGTGLEYYQQLKQNPASKNTQPFFKTQNKNTIDKKNFNDDQNEGFISFFPNQDKITTNHVQQKFTSEKCKEINKSNAIYKSPLRAGKIKDNKIMINQQNPQTQSPYRLATKYEDLNQRRKRLLTEYRNLNNLQEENIQENNQQSPYLRQKLNSYSSKQQQEHMNTPQYLPLTLTKMPKNNCTPFQSSTQFFNPNSTAKFLKENLVQPKPMIQSTQQLTKSYSRNQIYMSPLKRKNLNYTADYNNMVEQRPNYDNRNPPVQLSRNKSYSKVSSEMSQSMTPNKRKYQYYFND